MDLLRFDENGREIIPVLDKSTRSIIERRRTFIAGLRVNEMKDSSSIRQGTSSQRVNARDYSLER